MKKTLLVLVLALLGMTAMAKPVDPAAAQRVAANFWNSHRDNGVAAVSSPMTRVNIPFDGMYLFKAGERGFVFVAADDCVQPILGYSFTSPAGDRLNPEVKYWLSTYQQQIDWIRANGYVPDNEVADMWRAYATAPQGDPEPLTAVTPLMTTTWDQSPYYNNLCPYDNTENERTVTGCVATATAQVMKYWNHPVHGTGSHSYTHSTYGSQSANFAATTYDWANMPNYLTGASSTAQVTAVATLMYHIGVAIEMDYGTSSSGGSGAYTNNYGYSNLPCAQNALYDYFGYQLVNCYYRDDANVTDAIWAGYINTELNASRPVIYAGQDTAGGHCFVCDGYNNSNMYHFNWGWGGYQDGYYSLSNLAPGSGGTGGNATYTFNLSQRILTGIQPDSSYSPTNPLAPDANCLITSFPYTENFDDTSTYGCLRLYDANGDGATWGVIDSFGTAFSRAAYIMYAVNADDYLMLPGITTPGNYTINWKARIYNSNYPETYQVLAGSNMIFSETLSATSLTNRTANFTVTAGDTVVPMFRYISDDMYAFFIDDITISQNSTPPTPAATDTISWCDTNSIATSVGAGGAIYWGISLTPTLLTGHNYLKSVMLYVAYAGTYTLNVYTGGTTAPGTLSHTQTAVFSSTQLGWQEILLDATFPINATQNLWITFYNNDVTYPATACAYVGNTNSDWASVDGSSWDHLQNLSSSLTYSWLIKAVTSQTAGPLPAPTITINGPVSFATGTAQTFTATATAGATVTWSLAGATPSTGSGNTVTATWNTPGTYNIIATATSSTGIGRDTLTVTVVGCNTISTFPYTMGFEANEMGALACWTIVDANNDGYGWTTDISTNISGVIGSASYINGVGALTPDNWLITPQMIFPYGSSYTLSWKVSGLDADYYAEHYGVYVSTNGTTLSNFTLVQQYTMTTANETTMSLDLSGYAGQTVYIAFRHWNVTDQYWMLLDDVTVTQTSGPASYTITVQSADPTMGTVNGGGTFTAGSTTTISATANSGYHFTQWNDGNSSNPRSITVTGNATYIASFAADSPAPGTSDTISWCDTNSIATSVGAGGAIYWGISLTPTQLTGHNYLKSVMLYVAYAGTYTLNVYTGGTTAPGTLSHTQTAVFSSTQLGWQEIMLDATFPINATQNLWITFYNNDVTYPATACAYVGNTNSDWASVDGTSWDHLQSLSSSLVYSWLIKAVTSQTAGPLPAPTISITGPTSCATGVAQTFTATATAGATITWSLAGATPSTASGNTATATWYNPGIYNVVATATSTSGIGRDTLTINVINCGTISTFPYTMGFDSNDIAQFACWTVLDADNDGYSWTTDVFEGTVSSASYINNVGVLTPDNWLISPQMQFTTGSNYTLSWKTSAPDSTYYAEHYGVFVSTSGTATSNFSLVQQYTMTTHHETTMTLDLSAYAGQTIYIAFRHWNVTDVYWMRLDDITVTQTAIPGQNYTITVQSANPTMGSVTGGGTFTAGTTTTISATANAGYHFTMWNDGNTSNPRTITVTGNATYIANFESDAPTQYTITVLSSNETMGTVSGGGVYNEGTTVTISASANNGYHFTQWQDGNTNATRTITVTGNATYIANFEANPVQQYTITVLSNNDAWGSVSGGGVFNEGTTITISATPFNGYFFGQWNDGNTDNPRTITVTGNATYIANFTNVNGISNIDSDSWSLYPNPAANVVTITGVEQAMVTITDMTGRTVATHTVTDGNNNIDISQMTDGAYFLRITSNGASAIRKLVVK